MGSRQAVQAIAERANLARDEAADRWASVVPGPGLIGEWSELLRESGRLTLNFHPDRMTRRGCSVADGLADDGAYRSQWVTGISAGSRSAVRGGERQRFERELFEDAHDHLDPAAGEHPVYGALDLVLDEHGGSPRFGSSYVVLARHVRSRTTLCVGDSHLGPRDVGTFDELSSILAGLAEQAARRELFGRGLGPDDLVAILTREFRTGGASRRLDGYIEAQVHGGVSLVEDVEAIVCDPSFRGTEIDDALTRAGLRWGVDLRWHRGSELSVGAVPDDFRGPTMPSLARRVARSDGIVDARAIGLASAEATFEEPTTAGDPPESMLQQLKYLWHTVLAFGSDAPAPG